jgi:hypothetical protein
MYTNADITLYLYNKGKYTRSVIKRVFWSDTRQANVKDTGLANADAVKIMIPITSADNLTFTIGKDLVIKGIIEHEIDSTSQQGISNSLKYLNENYETRTVTSADDKRYGSKEMHHYDLSCK